MPWFPPAKGAEPFSFPYWVPWVSGIAMLAFSFLYWFVWTHVLPRMLGYKIYEEVVKQENGELSKQFIKVYDDYRGDEWRRKLATEKEKDEQIRDLAPVETVGGYDEETGDRDVKGSPTRDSEVSKG
jgi:hypothetical protein